MVGRYKVRFSVEARLFSFLQNIQTAYHPHFQSVLWDLYSGLKWPVREAGHTSLSSAEFKNAWSYASTAHMGRLGVNNGTFTFMGKGMNWTTDS